MWGAGLGVRGEPMFDKKCTKRNVSKRTSFKTGWPNQLRGCYPEGPCIHLKS